MKEIPEIIPIRSELEKYDLIILGTPVWAWTYSPPLAAFFTKHRLKDKKVAIFCCHGGGPGRTLEDMKKQLGGNDVVSQCDFKEPKRLETDMQLLKAKEWINEVINYLTNEVNPL